MDIERIKIYTDVIKRSLEKYSEYTLSVELSKSEMVHLKSLFNIAEGDFPGTYVFTKKTLDN